jgi:hypothetical protein
MDEGLDRSVGCCYGKARPTLHSHPVLVSQHGAGSEEVFVSNESIGSDWSKQVVHFKTGSIDGMSAGIQEAGAMPFSSRAGLMNRQVEQGFSDGTPARSKPTSKKSTGGKHYTPGLERFLGVTGFNHNTFTATPSGIDRKRSPARRKHTTFSQQLLLNGLLEAEARD